VGNRIIDLSYTAASRLDMLRNGTAMVEVRALDFPATTPDPGAPLLSAARASPSSGQAGVAASAGAASAGAASPGTASPGTASAATATSGAGTVEPGSAPTSAVRTVLFVQAGAFADPANAERLAAKLRGGGYGKIFVRDDLIAGRKMFRVRIGPVPDVPEFDRIVAALERAGVHDAHLALD